MSLALYMVIVGQFFSEAKAADPSGVSYTSPVPNEIDLAWAAPPKADYYEVWRGSTPAEEDLIAQPGVNHFADWDQVKPATTYYYTVIAITANGRQLVGSIAATAQAGRLYPTSRPATSKSP
jgi:fibronectin type 3 domain-containing protein